MLIYNTEMFGLDIWNLISAVGALTHLSVETKHGAMCFMLKSFEMEIYSYISGK